MLPRYWRLVAKNKAGHTLTYDSGARVAARYVAWKRDSDGALSEASEVSDDFGFGAAESIANGSWEKMAAAGAGYVDNSADKYEGIYGQFDVTSDHVSADGPVELYVEFSTNSSQWPSDDVADPDSGNDIEQHLVGPIASVDLDGAETKSVAFSWQAG
jgi:hypothetical protein